jgi:hypothetical protein
MANRKYIVSIFFRESMSGDFLTLKRNEATHALEEHASGGGC